MTDRFRVLLERPDGIAQGAFLRVPQSVMDAFAPQLRVPVVVTINGFSWHTTIAPYGAEFFVPVRAAVCASIGADAGDTVEVAMDRDSTVRKAEAPPDLARALEAAGAHAAFEGLSFTHQKEIAQSVAKAKGPETRQRRIEAAVAKVVAMASGARSGKGPRRPQDMGESPGRSNAMRHMTNPAKGSAAGRGNTRRGRSGNR